MNDAVLGSDHLPVVVDFELQTVEPSGLIDNSVFKEYGLLAFPNPVDETTRISFDLEQSENLNLSLHDQSGRTVDEVFDGELGQGRHEFFWSNASVEQGVYTIMLRSNSQVVSTRLVVISR